jgi:hypothetical protein
MLRTLFGNKEQNELLNEFEKKLIGKGKIQFRFLHILKDLINVKSKVSSGKLDQKEAEKIKAEAIELMNSLTEYAQRADLISAEKGTMQISYGNRKAELVLLGPQNFFIDGKDIKKFSGGKLVASNREEFEKALADNKGKLSVLIPGDIFAILEKEIGKFEVSF